MHTRAGVGPAAAKAVKNNPNLRGAMGKDSSRVRVQWHSIVLMEAAEYFAQCLPLEPLDMGRASNFMTPPHWMAWYYSNICLPCRTRTTSVQWLGNPSWLGNDWVPLIPHVTGALSHFLKPGSSACWDLLRLGKHVSWPKRWACSRNSRVFADFGPQIQQLRCDLCFFLAASSLVLVWSCLYWYVICTGRLARRFKCRIWHFKARVLLAHSRLAPSFNRSYPSPTRWWNCIGRKSGVKALVDRWALMGSLVCITWFIGLSGNRVPRVPQDHVVSHNFIPYIPSNGHFGHTPFCHSWDVSSVSRVPAILDANFLTTPKRWIIQASTRVDSDCPRHEFFIISQGSFDLFSNVRTERVVYIQEIHQSQRLTMLVSRVHWINLCHLNSSSRTHT